MPDQATLPALPEGTPDRLWLVLGEAFDEHETPPPWRDFEEVTWCEDKQFRNDIEFVRADVARAHAADLERRLAEAAADAERYRWLRVACTQHVGGLTIARVTEYELFPWSGDNPDRAIDRAMAPARSASQATGEAP